MAGLEVPLPVGVGALVAPLLDVLPLATSRAEGRGPVTAWRHTLDLSTHVHLLWRPDVEVDTLHCSLAGVLGAHGRATRSPLEMCVPIARWMPEHRMQTNTPLRVSSTNTEAHRFQEAQRASIISAVACRRRPTILAAVSTALVVRLLDEISENTGVTVRSRLVCPSARPMRTPTLPGHGRWRMEV